MSTRWRAERSDVAQILPDDITQRDMDSGRLCNADSATTALSTQGACVTGSCLALRSDMAPGHALEVGIDVSVLPTSLH